jgi:hypothetical protein
MRKLFSFLFFWIILLWVFWETGNTLSYPVIVESLTHLHSVDFMGVIEKYHFPIITTLSYWFNIVIFIYIKAFIAWLKKR